MIAAQMTKKEAIRRLENLALETGHKRNYYVKRALIEFLDRNERLLGETYTNGFRDPPRSLLGPEQVSSLIRAA
jgi:predicted transcriptional regulator